MAEGISDFDLAERLTRLELGQHAQGELLARIDTRLTAIEHARVEQRIVVAHGKGAIWAAALLLLIGLLGLKEIGGWALSILPSFSDLSSSK